MIFTTLPFFVFFTIVYALLLAIRNDIARRWILLGASFFFYGYWNVWYLPLMWAVILWSWGLGLFIEGTDDPRRKQLGVAIGTTLSLSALAVFKYAGFFSQNVASLAGGEVPKIIREIVLPVGISFYTFHSISYYVDVYRGQVKAAKTLRDYALYIAFFPQLVAGPIVRASQFLPQLDRPVRLGRDGFAAGLRLLLAGMFQKLVLADQVSPFVDRVFANTQLYSGTTEWLAVLAYALQIFGDFSGYTLMAIGIALILGFQLPQNFRMPYISTSITEFWRRWHITLSFFLRDYLYIPLGGNRGGFLATQRNVLITMLLGGLWHGASWNFVLWGALHGTGVVTHNVWRRALKARGDAPPPLPKFVRLTLGWAITFLFVLMVWIPFRAVHLSDTLEIARRIWTLSDGVRWYHTPTVYALMAAFAWHVGYLLQIRERMAAYLAQQWIYTIEITGLVTLLLLFAPVSTSPFIYFQF
jgi:alginate O-acetyltransferase complex protein AlgI